MNTPMTDKFFEVRRKFMRREFSRMNEKQLEAVFYTEGPLLILAGAGSGKTTVLVNRIANIIKYGNAYYDTQIPENITSDDMSDIIDSFENNWDLSPEQTRKLAVEPAKPWQILAITFTNKAAGELKERLSSMLGQSGDDVWASTFHSTCARILRRDGDKIGYSNHFTVYDTDDSRRLIKDCQKALNIDDKMLSYKSIMSEISRAKDSLISCDEYKQNAGTDFRMLKIAEVYQMYQKRLKEADAMDFDDLIVNTVKLFQECEDVLECYQDRFKYILVDEYQDTNSVQYVLIKLLAGKYRNLCVVGDDDQSIYKFRGATIENILSFEKTYPDAKVIRLEQNYRSTKNILNAANAVIENNENRKGKMLWTDNEEGEKITVHTASNEHDEANYITNVILDGVAKGMNYSDFSILYRMNAQSNMIEKVFVKSGIPYRIIGGFRFYERKEIRDMIAYLSVINNPSDEIRLRRIINQPKRSIGDKTITQAMEIAAEVDRPLLEVIRHADEFDALKRTAPKLQKFADLIDGFIYASKQPGVSLHDLYDMILEKTEYIDALKAEKEESESRIENINELASNIIKYEEDNGENASLSGFLEEVSLMTDIDNYDGDADTVVMMTMHSAKGLEFPVVFLPGFEEGIFPGVQSMYNPSELEEERRLAYVGITRAKQRLYILNADSRMIYGSTNRNKQSRFAIEIPPELVERTRAKDWKKPEPGVEMPKSAYESRQKSTFSSKSFGQIPSQKPQSCERLSEGDRVGHKVFGNGVVMSATPMGNDVLLEILFDGVGTKKLMSNFARLQKI